MKIWKIGLVADSDFHTYGDSKGSILDYLKGNYSAYQKQLIDIDFYVIGTSDY